MTKIMTEGFRLLRSILEGKSEKNGVNRQLKRCIEVSNQVTMDILDEFISVSPVRKHHKFVLDRKAAWFSLWAGEFLSWFIFHIQCVVTTPLHQSFVLLKNICCHYSLNCILDVL